MAGGPLLRCTATAAAAALLGVEAGTLVRVADVRRAVAAQREVTLAEALRGAALCGPPPPPRPPRSAELEERCQRLRRAAEDAEYADMVKDVDPGKGRGAAGGPLLCSYVEQLGFGLHVVTVMFACFVGGTYAGKHALGPGAAGPLVGGLAGAILALLVEATLFLIRGA